MQAQESTILIVDDEAVNIELLEETLRNAGYTNLFSFSNPQNAMQMLEREAGKIDLVLLDWMMPGMDGLTFLSRMKQRPEMHDIPVIMQTALTTRERMVEGINAGVYYYLTKPYDERILISVVRAALENRKSMLQLRSKARQYEKILHLFQEMHIELHTLEEAQDIAALLANCFPDPDRVVFGISEMLINAIEHGNLCIGYEEKTTLLLQGTWEQEVTRRLTLPECRHKKVSLHFTRTLEEITLTIRDEGIGFEWQPFLEIQPSRATHIHGRGIAVARKLSFDTVRYLGSGNEVMCSVRMENLSPSI